MYVDFDSDYNIPVRRPYRSSESESPLFIAHSIFIAHANVSYLGCPSALGTLAVDNIMGGALSNKALVGTGSE